MVYFPFAKKINFKTRKNIIVPRLSAQDWIGAVAQKKIVIVNNGDYLENIITLSFLEAIKFIYPSAKIEVITEYPELYYYQGLSTPSEYELNNDTLLKYTSPIFFNKTEDTVYFNTLYNYRLIYNYIGQFIKKNKSPLYNQIIPNILTKWKYDYCPKFRRDFRINNNINNYILIIPDKLPWSNDNKVENFSWKNQDLKSFVSLMNTIGIKSIVLSPQSYYGINENYVRFVQCSLESLIYYTQEANFIISKEYDYLLSVPFLNSKCKIINKPIRNIFDIQYNLKDYEFNNKLINIDEITPITIFDRIKYGT